MRCIKVTIAATGVAQPIIVQTQNGLPPTNTGFQNAIFQNNGTHSMWLGDALVTITNGLQLYATGSAQPSQPIDEPSDLKEFWVIGTTGDILNIMVFE